MNTRKLILKRLLSVSPAVRKEEKKEKRERNQLSIQNGRFDLEIREKKQF